MRLLLGSIAPLTLVMLVIGCNTVDPSECWPNTSGGLGGGGPIPIGAGVGASSGDFISPPRGPLDYGGAPNPCIVTQSPCNEKCLADYDAAATVCGKIAADAQRKSCQDKAYADYQHCRGACAGDPVEKCKQQCDKIHDSCHANCTKNDPTSACHAKCNDQYATCLKDCER
jgi:hypothetical protein